MGKYKGGYIIVSLALLDIASSGATKEVKGIYEKLEGSYGKPILLTDIVLDGVEKHDIFVMAEVVGTNYVINDVYGKQINITQGDYIIALDNPKNAFSDLIGYERIQKDAVEQRFTLSALYVGNLIIIKTNTGHTYCMYLRNDGFNIIDENGAQVDSSVISECSLNTNSICYLGFADTNVTEIEISYLKFQGNIFEL